VKTKSYLGMKRLAENRENWRAGTNQSLDWWPMMMNKNLDKLLVVNQKLCPWFYNNMAVKIPQWCWI
jgi:hypothetical protein